jgi:hypothetical protein
LCRACFYVTQTPSYLYSLPGIAARRKEIYLEFHPKTRIDKICQPTFSEATTETTGKSARTIRLDAERGKKVSDAALDMIRGTALDTGPHLDTS